jgi:hypothetical protein
VLAFPLVARQQPLSDLEKSTTLKTIDGQILYFRGTAVHRRYFFDIYELTLYLKDQNEDSPQIISNAEIKYARMKLLRNLSASDLREGFTDTYNESCAEDCESLREQLKTFLDAIQDMTESSMIEFTFYLDKTIISGASDKKLEFPGVEFGKIFLRAWVGKSPPSERFKRELLRDPRYAS